MKRVALSEVKDELSRYLRLAAGEEVVITRHGKPAGVLIGFKSEEEWFEYRLESHPRFLKRIAEAPPAPAMPIETVAAEPAQQSPEKKKVPSRKPKKRQPGALNGAKPKSGGQIEEPAGGDSVPS